MGDNYAFEVLHFLIFTLFKFDKWTTETSYLTVISCTVDDVQID